MSSPGLPHIDLSEQTLCAIGEGAMARVYAAQHPEFGEIAVKLMRQSDEASLRRMVREAGAQARLDHPHIGKVYGYGEFKGQPAILMQRVHGRPLNEIGAALTLEARVKLFVDVCDAVEHAHAAGLVHRDLKPANILVEEAGDRLHAYVLDFGLVRDDEDGTLTTAGDLLGTPAYMSPEQARGDARHVDRRSDVFSLGAILFHLLVGHAPFAGGSVSEVIGRILSEDAPLAHRQSPQAPLALSRICAQCLERQPARRYDSARALRSDLQHWLRGESLQARSVGWRYRTTRWLRRNRGIGAALLALLLVSSGAVAWSLYERVQGREREALVARISGASEAVRQHMRLARLTPPQSLQPTVAALSERLETLQEQARLLPDRSATRAQLALAQAWLDLERPAQALDLLRPAQQRTPQDVELLRSLASALVGQYQDLRAGLADRSEAQIEAALGPEGVALREQAEVVLNRALELDPETPPLARARLALLQGRYDQALADLAGWRAVDVADYRGPALRAEVLAARAQRAAERGELDQAQADLAQAREQLELALQTGRSDFSLLLASCRAATAAISLNSNQGHPPPASPALASGACDTALLVRPDHGDGAVARTLAWSAIARAHDVAGASEAHHAALQAMRADAEVAAALQPERFEPGLLLARAEVRLAQLRLGGFEHSLDSYNSTLQRLEALNARFPGTVPVLSELATLYRQRGRLKALYQRDPGDDFALAGEHFQQALALRPDSVSLAEDLSLTWVFAFYSERVRDPQAARTLAERAISALDPLLARQPDHPDTLATQAANLADLCAYLTGLFVQVPDTDPYAELYQRSHQIWAHLRQVAPQRPEGYFGPAMLELTLSELRHERGQSAPIALHEARRMFDAAAAAGLQLPASLMAWQAVEHAREALAGESDTAALVAAARSAIAAAYQGQHSTDNWLMARRAELTLASAEVQAAQRRGTRDHAALTRGLQVFEELRDSGRDFGSGMCEGALLYTRKGYALQGTARREAFETAAAAYRHCIASSPHILAYQRPRLEQVERLLAELQDAD